MSGIVSTPKPPYYAVIFTSIRKEGDEGYTAMAEKMESLAQSQTGFLGMESARGELGISISYWADLDAINSWRTNAQHRIAKDTGKQHWYKQYRVRIALVEQEY